MNRKRFNELHWLFRQASPFITLHLLSIGCVIVASVMTLADPLIMKWLIDDILPSKDLTLLPVAAAGFLLTFIGQYLFAGFSGQISFTATQQMIFRIRGEVFQHLLALSAAYYDKNPVGELQHRLEQDVEQLGRLSGNFLIYSFRLITVSATVLVTMFALSPRLTLISLPLLPAFLVVRKIHQERLQDCSNHAEARAGEVSSFLQSHISAIAQIQLLCFELRVHDRFSRLANLATRAEIRRTRKEFCFFMLSMIVLVAAFALVFGYGGKQVIAGTLSTGGLVAFYSLLIRLFEPFSSAVDMVSKAQRVKACVRRVLEVIETPPGITEPACPNELHPDLRTALEFRNVHFSYTSDKRVLSGVSITVKLGEKVALVGMSGNGKSTLAKLATRLYDVDEGAILLGGCDIRELSLTSLRKTVSLLPQEPILLGNTIRENLLHGNPNASYCELDRVAGLAQLHSVIRRLPQGWDHPIGPRGAMLSGGERQRVALARTILHEPRILILDEFTSALDTDTEHKLLQSMNQALTETTLIVISHRITTALWADRILVLKQDGWLEEITATSLLKDQHMHLDFLQESELIDVHANGKREKALHDPLILS